MKCAPFRCEPLERRLLLAAGDYDSSFSEDGRATVNFGPGLYATATAAVVQPDGKTVVVGTVSPFAGAYSGEFAVARFNLDGSLDTSFGPARNGTVVVRINARSRANAVALQDDGRIVVVGQSSTGPGGDPGDINFAVARFTPNGTLDGSFDDNGLKTIEFTTSLFHADSYANAVVVQRDGRILIGGSMDASGLVGEIHEDYAFARLNPDGSFDSSLDGDGKLRAGLGGDDVLTAMEVNYNDTPQANPDWGKIVAVGRGGPGEVENLLVLRLNPDGSRDEGFSGDGELAVPFAADSDTVAAGVVIQPDNRIVVGGDAAFSPTTHASGLVMVRFLRNGAVDSSFGSSGDGWAFAEFGTTVREAATDLLMLSDGGLVLSGQNRSAAGTSGAGPDLLAAYNADGQPDPRFGPGGQKTLSTRGGLDLTRGPGKRFVLAGGDDFLTSRLLEAGANLIYISSLDEVATEAGQMTAGVIIYRVERVPVTQRVYFNVGGTARSPLIITFPRRDPDYTGLSSDQFDFTTAYVDIPANQTFVSFVITAVDDALVEGNETAVFTLLDQPYYDVGTPSSLTLRIVDNDAPPPSVAEVYVRGTSWAHADNLPENVTFQEFLANSGMGDAEFGYRVDNVAGGATLPWTNVNQVVLRYTSPPTGAGVPTTGGVGLDGARSDYTASEVTQIDPRTFAITLDRPLGDLPAGGNDGDRIRLTVPGGAAGGTYELRFNVLQGDVNRSGSVVANDFSEVKSRFFRTTNAPGAGANAYSPLHDVDASGSILANDFSAVKARFFDALPAPALQGPAAAGLAAGVSSLLTGKSTPWAGSGRRHRSSPDVSAGAAVGNSSFR